MLLICTIKKSGSKIASLIIKHIMRISRYRTWEFETGHAFIFIKRLHWKGLPIREREIERRVLVSRKYFLKVKASGSLYTFEAAPVDAARCSIYSSNRFAGETWRLSFNLSQRWREFNHELSPEGKSRWDRQTA